MTMTDDKRPVVQPTEVRPKAKRRSFSAEFKRRVLVEAAACTKPGEVGALLRREGLYSSHLTARASAALPPAAGRPAARCGPPVPAQESPHAQALQHRRPVRARGSLHDPARAALPRGA
jgi:hypothetical protein